LLFTPATHDMQELVQMRSTGEVSVFER
jgi:hypothetical protein